MEKPDVWALFNHLSADTYYRKGKICLLDDSAHASAPHQGAGAGDGARGRIHHVDVDGGDSECGGD